jgi:hypothetical protein
MNVCENHALPSSKAPFASVVFPKGGKKKKKLLPATMQALDFEGGC